MLQFKQHKSYLWLFPIYIATLTGGCVLSSAFGNSSWGILTMPAFAAFILMIELKSNIALDSWWQASHLKGSRLYQVMIAWHGIVVMMSLILSSFIISMSR